MISTAVPPFPSDKRPEDPVFREAHQEFCGTVARDHGLDEEPIEASGGVGRSHPLDHCRRFLPGPFGVIEVERDATDVTLVADIGRANFERDGEPDFRGDRSGVLWISSEVIGDDRYAIGREDRAGFFWVEPGFPIGECGGDHSLRCCRIRLERIRPPGWRFHQKLLIAAMMYPVQETGDCAVWCLVGSNARVGKELPGRLSRMLAEPSSDYVTTAERRGSHCGYGIDHGTCGVLGLRQRMGTIQHQNRIDLWVTDQRRQGISIARPRSVADDVDRIPATPGRWQSAIQISDRRFRQCGQLASCRNQSVYSEDACSAAIGQDREPFTDLLPGQRQGLRCIK